MKYFIYLLVFLAMISSTLAEPPWINDSCTDRYVIAIANNKNIDMVDFDINITLNTESLNDGIYFVDRINGSGFEAIKWWNETAWGTTNTKIWFRTNISALNTSDDDVQVYYNCGGSTPKYTRNETQTFWYDFDEPFHSLILGNSSNSVNCALTMDGMLNFYSKGGGCSKNIVYLNKTFSMGESYKITYDMSFPNVPNYELYNQFSDDATQDYNAGNSIGWFFDPSDNQIIFRGYTASAIAFTTTFTPHRLFNLSMLPRIVFNTTQSVLQNISNDNMVNYAFSTPAWMSSSNKYYLRFYAYTAEASVKNITIDNLSIIKYWQDSSFNYSIIASAGEYQQLSLLYSANVTSGQTQTFTLNNWYNPLRFPLIASKFYYNGTEYTPLKTDLGGGYTKFNVSITAPTVSAKEMRNFWWNTTIYNATDGRSFISTIGFQEVAPLIIQPCSGGNTTDAVAINFTFYRENNITTSLQSMFHAFISIGTTTTTKDFNVTIQSNSTSAKLCIPANMTFYADADIDYESPTYTKRNFFMKNSYISNVTTEIKLYLLETADDDSLQIVLQDDLSTPITDAYVYVDRYYPELSNPYKTVAMGRTDSEGMDVIPLRFNDVYYRWTFVKDGAVIWQTTNGKITSSPLTFTVTPSTFADYFTTFNGISVSLVNTSSTVVLTYTDTTGTAGSVCLKVLKRTQGDVITVCDECRTAVSGVIQCSLTDSDVYYTAYAYAKINPEWTLASLSIDKVIQKIKEYSALMLFLAIIVVMVLGLIGFSISGASVGIIFSLVGLILMRLIDYISMDYRIMMGLVFIGLIVAWVMKE